MMNIENSSNLLWKNSRVCEEREGCDLVEIELQFNHAGFFVHRHNTAANGDASVPEYLYLDDTLDKDA